MSIRKWNLSVARGMGSHYHWLHGLETKPILIECTESEAILISAAPDLLAFAQWLVDAWHGEGMPNPCQIAAAARAAIAKATCQEGDSA